MLRRLFGKRKSQPDPALDLTQALQGVVDSFDLDDPATRAGISLHFVLSKQFDLIGKQEGEFPYISPFASDKARGALLGTAIAIVRREYGDTPNDAIIDATITAFTLAYGAAEGGSRALQTIEDAASGNDEIKFASDWAIKDTEGAIEDSSPTTPAAYYLAVSGMI